MEDECRGRDRGEGDGEQDGGDERELRQARKRTLDEGRHG